MKKETKRKIISKIHQVITIYFSTFPYITPKFILPYSLYFSYTIILHWYYFNGRCWLSILEDKYKPKDEPKTNMFHFFKTYKIPLFVFDFFIYLNIVYSCYILDMLWKSLYLIGMLLYFNKIIYGSIKFK
jgi:hypothetical protein